MARGFFLGPFHFRNLFDNIFYLPNALVLLRLQLPTFIPELSRKLNHPLTLTYRINLT